MDLFNLIVGLMLVLSSVLVVALSRSAWRQSRELQAKVAPPPPEIPLTPAVAAVRVAHPLRAFLLAAALPIAAAAVLALGVVIGWVT